MNPGYDAIAHLYDVDMARNMPFDDVAFYSALASNARGPVLELGCGNGRILLELLARGIDACGVDASARMLAELERKAAARGLAPRTWRADMRTFAIGLRFALVLCPYSLLTYVLTDAETIATLRNVRAHLAPGGSVVLDAFVPRPVAPWADYRRDYERPLPAGAAGATLVRSKRLRSIGTNNTIERRYDVLTADGDLVQRIETTETIRPLSPDALRGLVVRAGFRPHGEWWDYGTREPDSAQFFTLLAG